MSEEDNCATILNKMEQKENYEDYMMKSQYNLAKASLDEAYSAWRKEQLMRRKRYIQQNGLNAALEKGYHVPFWQWWMTKLLENVSE